MASTLNPERPLGREPGDRARGPDPVGTAWRCEHMPTQPAARVPGAGRTCSGRRRMRPRPPSAPGRWSDLGPDSDPGGGTVQRRPAAARRRRLGHCQGHPARRRDPSAGVGAQVSVPRRGVVLGPERRSVRAHGTWRMRVITWPGRGRCPTVRGVAPSPFMRKESGRAVRPGPWSRRSGRGLRCRGCSCPRGGCSRPENVVLDRVVLHEIGSVERAPVARSLGCLPLGDANSHHRGAAGRSVRRPGAAGLERVPLNMPMKGAEQLREVGAHQKRL